MIFYQFFIILHQNFDIDNVIVKIISSVFNVHLFNFSHFISLVNCCLIKIIISRIIFFITNHVFIVSNISANSNIIVKNIEKITMYTMQELFLLLSIISTSSSIVSLHSSTNLSTNPFLHAQFL